MKHFLKYFSAFLVALAMVVSCKRPVIEGAEFVAKLEIVSKSVGHGEDFTFKVYSNMKSFKITKFDCPFETSEIEPGMTFSVSELGYYLFTIKNVKVSESGHHTLSMTVVEPVSGLACDLSEDFNAYTSSNISLVIENERAAGSKFSDKSYGPAVIGGDDFVFTVRSRSERLLLKSYTCEFNDGQLFEGEEFVFDELGEKRITMESVDVDMDAFNEKHVLSMTFYNLDSKRDTTVTAEYICLRKFEPTVTLEPSSLVYNGTASLKFAANRQNVELVSDKEPAWFKFADGRLRITDLGENLKLIVKTQPLVIPEGEGDGSLEFEIKDAEYTGRTEKVVVPYKIARNIPPQDISFSFEGNYVETAEKVIEINQDELLRVKLSTSTKNSDNLYSVSVVKTPSDTYTLGKDIALYAPGKGESRVISDIKKHDFVQKVTVTDNDFYINTNLNSGFFRISVSAKNDSSVSREIALYVKDCFVVFVVEEEQYDLEWNYVTFSRAQKTAWYGLPSKLTGYFASWGNNLSPEEQLVKYGHTAFGSYLSNKLTRRNDINEVSVSWTIDFAPNQSSDDYLYVPTASCNDYNVYVVIHDKYSHYFQEGGLNPGHHVDAAAPDGSSELKYEQLPLPGKGLISGTETASLTTGEIDKFYLNEAMNALKKLDCKGDIAYARHDRMDYDYFPSRPERYWTHLNFNITNFNGIGDTYKVKYILYNFKWRKESSDYWWKSIDKVGVLVDAETGNTIVAR